jgi:ribosomal protein S25
MEEIKEEIEKGFAGHVDILAGSKETEVTDKGKGRNGSSEIVSLERAEDEIIEMVLRRPCTAADIAGTLKLGIESATEILRNMENRGDLIAKIHGGKKYFRTPMGKK